MYDESEFIIINNNKLVKNGTMDDVYILDKVFTEEIQPILFIQSCVPKFKEFAFNIRENHQNLSSPYLKEFEGLLIQLVF